MEYASVSIEKVNNGYYFIAYNSNGEELIRLVFTDKQLSKVLKEVRKFFRNREDPQEHEDVMF